ncbi:hypothetical protein [Planococcus antarcticus]|nr:hypothetical protein [Planococcus antarcticus]
MGTKTKDAGVYHILLQIEKSNSAVSRETVKDPQKTLDLVRCIMET